MVLVCVCCSGSTGLEPATSSVTGKHSNQLNYDPFLFAMDGEEVGSKSIILFSPISNVRYTSCSIVAFPVSYPYETFRPFAGFSFLLPARMETNILGLIATALFIIVPTSFLLILFVKTESQQQLGNLGPSLSQRGTASIVGCKPPKAFCNKKSLYSSIHTGLTAFSFRCKLESNNVCFFCTLRVFFCF